MKFKILLLLLLSSITARAQTNSQPMTEELCGHRGVIYVTKKNKEEEPAPNGFQWNLVEAHYDSRTSTCYVRYDRFATWLGMTMERIRIDDIEGNHVAGYSATWAADRGSYPNPPAYTKPTECNVNGTSCESKVEFETLLAREALATIQKKYTPCAQARARVSKKHASRPDV